MIRTTAPTAQPPGSAFVALDAARGAAASSLRDLLAWQLARTVLRLGFAGAAAFVVGRLVMGDELPLTVLACAAVLLATVAFTGFLSDLTQARAETEVAIALRASAASVLRAMPARTLRLLPAGTLSVAMQRHPQAVAALVTGHRAATVMMAAGPLLAAAALLAVSWQAALLVLGLTPVMILFFVLVGETIRARAEARERAFGRLAGQFADRLRTLPTILANHALETEEAKLTDRLRAYATSTMAVLRIAFLNAGIIDFFASLSIAMLAIFLGLGHLKLAMIPGFSNLELWQSLLILMIAPEYFAPFRRYAEQYHAKAEGLAAAAALDRLLGVTAPDVPMLAAVDRAIESLDLPEYGLVAILGPSGSGKSTLLRRLAGVEGAAEPGLQELGGRSSAWVATDSFVPKGTLASAIAWGARDNDPGQIRAVAGQVGLVDDRLLPGGLDANIEEGGANLSGGQTLRIAIARALLSKRIVLADEPTTKLDPATAKAIRAALRAMAATRLVLVATHDIELAAMADRCIDLAAAARLGVAA